MRARRQGWILGAIGGGLAVTLVALLLRPGGGADAGRALPTGPVKARHPVDLGLEEEAMDRYFAPPSTCDPLAILALEGGDALIGHNCNRLGSTEVSSLTRVEATGAHRPSAFDRSASRDRTEELIQLLPLGDSGVLATYQKRGREVPRGPFDHWWSANRAVLHTLEGEIDAGYTEQLRKSLKSVVGGPAVIAAADVDREGRVVLLASAPVDGDGPPPAGWLIRLGVGGELERHARLPDATGLRQLSQLACRPDLGLLLVGRLSSSASPIGLATLDADWKLDLDFRRNLDAHLARDFRTRWRVDQVVVEPSGKIIALGYYQGPLGQASILRLTATGEIDSTFEPFRATLGRRQTAAFWDPGLVLDPAGRVLVPFRIQASSSEPTPAEPLSPGLLRLRPDGTVDADFAEALGTGFHDHPKARVGHGDEVGYPWLRTLGIFPDGALVVAGHFDTMDGSAVPPAIRLRASGERDATFSLPLHLDDSDSRPPPPATTSAFFEPDSREHYIACSRPGAAEPVTFMYVFDDGVYHPGPSCLVHYSGSIASPEGTWQSCDAKVFKEQQAGATCIETYRNPLHRR